MRIQAAEQAKITYTQLRPLPPIIDVKRAAPMSQRTMDMNILFVPRQVKPESWKERLRLVHDHLDQDSHARIIHRHEHRKQEPRENSPGGTKDEVAGPGSDRGREAEQTSVDLPG